MSYIQQFFTSRDNNANAETFVGQEGRLWWDPVTNQIYSSDGSTPGGIPLSGGGGGNGSPGGANSQIQFNSNGTFGGTANLTIDRNTGQLSTFSLVAVGNVDANFFNGDGSALTNLPQTYTDANVASYLPTYTGNLNSLLGNVTTTANVSAGYFIGNGSQLTGITTTYGNANVAAYLPTYTGNLNPNFVNASGNLDVDGSATIGGNLFVTGNINFSGNVNQISGNSGSFFGNAAGIGALYAGVPVGYSNVITAVIQATSDLNDYTQINAQNLNHGNTASMEYVVTADIGTDTTNYLDMGIAGSGWDGTQVNSLGNAVAALDGWLYVQGGVTGGNLILGTTSAGKTIKFNASGPNAQNTVAEISTTGFSTTGNVTSRNIFANIAAANVVGTVATAATVTSNAQPNITSLGNLTSVTVTGNVTGGNVNLNSGRFAGGSLSVLGAVTGGSLTTAGNLAVTGNATITGNTATGNLSVTGNVNAGNLRTTGVVSALGGVVSSGEIYSATAVTGGNVSGATLFATGNVTGGNILTGGLMSAAGNVTGNYFIGNGAALTAIAGANVTGTVANATYAVSAGSATSATTAGTVTTNAQPNITSVGTLTSIASSGNISTTGNVTADYFIGNGSQLTGISTSSNIIFNGTSNVEIATASGPVTITSGTRTWTFGTGGALDVPKFGDYEEYGRVRGNGLQLRGDTNGGGSYTNIILPNNNDGVTNALTVANEIGNVWIYANGNTWEFNGNGNLTAPGNVIADTFISNEYNVLTAGNLSVTSQYGLGVTGTILENGGTLELIGNGTGAGTTGCVVVGWNSSYGAGLGPVAQMYFNPPGSSGNAVVTTGNLAATSYEWAFSDTGTMSFPSNAINTGTNPVTLWSNDSSKLLWRDSAGGAPGLPVQTTITAGNGTATITVATGLLAVQTQRTWTFNTAGNVVFPDTTVQTTAYPGTATSLSVTGNITGGNINTGGLVSATGNVTGGNLNATGLSLSGNVVSAINATANITTTANIAGGNIIGTHVGNLTGTTASLSGNVTGGNLISTGAVYSNYNTNTANTGSFMAQGGNTKGGTGYLDFLVAQNTSGGATNPYKWLRTTSDGQLQIINSAYTTNIFNLTDAGAFSVPGPISVGSKQAVNGPAFSAYAAAILQNIPNGTQTKVLFQTEEFDTNNNYASSRFTPTVEGYYQLNAEVRLDGASGTGEMMIVLYKNGSEYKRGWNQSGTQIASSFWAMTVSSVAYANGSTDYFEIYVQQGSGGTISVTAVNAPAITWFNGCMLRGA